MVALETPSRIWWGRCATAPTVAERILPEPEWYCAHRHTVPGRDPDRRAPGARLAGPPPSGGTSVHLPSPRPRQLSVWHPGYGTALAGPESGDT